MLYIRCFYLVSLVISWRNIAILVCSFWLSLICVGARTPGCSNGLEFECKTVQGDGKTCVTGCNVTIAKSLSPGNCTEGCCTFCHSDCIDCSYTKVITFCVLNYKNYTNSSLTQQVFPKQSMFFKSLHKDIVSSLQASLPSKILSATSFEIVILRTNWCSPIQNGLKVIFKIVTKNMNSLELMVAEMKNASRVGKLGNLILVKNVLWVLDEYEETQMSQQKKREEELDIVELVITCIAALIVIFAIIWCLFYLCTTPAQRARYKCCKACKRNQTAHA